MYRMTLSVDPVMGGWQVSARLLEQDWEDGAWGEVASREDTIVSTALSPEDAFLALMVAVRLWSEQTIPD